MKTKKNKIIVLNQNEYDILIASVESLNESIAFAITKINFMYRRIYEYYEFKYSDNCYDTKMYIDSYIQDFMSMMNYLDISTNYHKFINSITKDDFYKNMPIVYSESFDHLVYSISNLVRDCKCVYKMKFDLSEKVQATRLSYKYKIQDEGMYNYFELVRNAEENLKRIIDKIGKITIEDDKFIIKE